jgi:hypothetical protein
LFQIITGRKPFGHRHEPDIRRTIVAGDKPALPAGDDLISPICDNCVAMDFSNRPEFFHVVQALMNHPHPLFVGQDSDAFTNYKNEVFASMIQSEEAE